MNTTDPPHQESAVHILSDDTKDQPHLLLKASDSQSKYVQSLEERLAELERKFEELAREKTETPSEAGLADTSSYSHAANEDENTEGKEEDEKEVKEEKPAWVIIPKARKLNYTNFMSRFPIQTKIPVVEALMINTTISAAEKEDDHWFPEEPVEEPEKRLREMLEKNPYKPDAWMARIRINSVPLVEEVMKVLGTSEKFSTSVTFVHPFDPLVHSHDKLKARLHEMQVALATQQDEFKATSGAEASDKADATEETNPDKIEPTELVSLMEVFVQFLEDEVPSLSPKNATKIRFVSLSSIFNIGDTLFVPSADKEYRPNPDVLIRRKDQRLWRLYRIKRDWDEDGGSFLVKAYAIDYDGENYICQKERFQFDHYDGEQEISSLPVFPLKYLENAEQIRVTTRAQGKDFVEYQQGLVTHQGWGAELETGNESQMQYVTGDVVVDMAEATSTHSECVQNWGFPKYVPSDRSAKTYSTWNWKIVKGKYELDSAGPSGEMRYWINEYSRLQKMTYCSETDPFLSYNLKNKDKKYQLQEQDFELLPRRVFGYVLQKRKFLALDIRNLEPIKSDDMYNSKLILDQHHKSMLHGLIDSHFQKKDLREKHRAHNFEQDFIANKGRGLIVLLYGVPGVGKTSTAEQIAHSWRKPLLPVTCGNLGTESNEVEDKLKEIFRLGKKWDCILLMDEADVFLSERTPMALERNALVSVFLRELEYFDGVLFLTTNLPGGIDEAFKSRIHMTLYYPHLNESDTRAIWKVNMERLKGIEEQRARLNNKPPLSINERAIRKYAREHFRNNEDGKGRWNGRQIRNAFLIASALAHFEKANPNHAVPTTSNPDLDDPSFDINPRHFDVVAKASLDFEKYLAEAKGRLSPEIMFQRGQRADFIRPSSEQTAGSSSLKTHVPHPQTHETQGLSNAPDPFRSQKGWSESPAGLYSHQTPVEDQNWTLQAGYPYGAHQGHGAPMAHQGRLFQTPQQDPRMIPTPNLGGNVQSRRDVSFQGSPSPFQQNHQTNFLSGKMNTSANPDSDSDSDA
ncbi:ATPase, AAA-type, core [Penicillium italicum]|uniref:ATPase, AAA-type, core n=1 Tax=Penicillium italicum TaxID=40296 RepID=A0A0A2LBH7_PENIT|nr:ATPase, AAA-type, core [Penicillium italicum]